MKTKPEIKLPVISCRMEPNYYVDGSRMSDRDSAVEKAIERALNVLLTNEIGTHHAEYEIVEWVAKNQSRLNEIADRYRATVTSAWRPLVECDVPIDHPVLVRLNGVVKTAVRRLPNYFTADNHLINYHEPWEWTEIPA